MPALPAGEAEGSQRADRYPVRMPVTPAGGPQHHVTEAPLSSWDGHRPDAWCGARRRRPGVPDVGANRPASGVRHRQNERHRFTEPCRVRPGPGEHQRAHAAGEREIHDDCDDQHAVGQQQRPAWGRGEQNDQRARECERRGPSGDGHP